MKWIGIVVIGLAACAALVAGIGAALPRTHKVSRTLRVKRAPLDVWPALVRAMGASPTPVDVLENDPPRRMVSRVKETEKNFGGTWTVAIADAGSTGRPETTVTITEDGWVANPIFRFVSRFVMGHHATMDGILTQVAKGLNEEAVLSGE